MSCGRSLPPFTTEILQGERAADTARADKTDSVSAEESCTCFLQMSVELPGGVRA